MFEQQTILKPKWQQRFDFFDSIENMTEEEKKSVYKKAPFSVKFNWLGFFFGSYYIIFLGAWRTGLFLWFCSSVISWGVSSKLDRVNVSENTYIMIEILVSILLSIYFGLISNHIHYCSARKNIDNPKELKNIIMPWH